MYKKLYSLLASILILSACTTDELWQEPNLPNQPDSSEITVSFDMEAPMEVISKSTTLPNETADPAPYVKNLVLYTFDDNNDFIGPVEAKLTTGATARYTAVIKRTTRKIHFISNYGNTGNYAVIPAMKTKDAGGEYTATESTLLAETTKEYVYWAEKPFNPESPSFGTAIELRRNWSALSVRNLSNKSGALGKGISQVSYYVYSDPQLATYVSKPSGINVPDEAEWNRPSTIPEAIEWTAVGEDEMIKYSYLRENDNSIPATATFVILKATYNDGSNTPCYYKIDISETNKSGVTKIHNIVRNNWYNITIDAVLQKGVATWDEVISKSKLPDNNIMAAVEINDYPKVSYDGYSLEVSPKTTYIFTSPNDNENVLDIKVTYKNKTGQTINTQISDLYFTSTTENVVVGGNNGITFNKENGTITAKIKAAGDQEEIAEFYIIAGELQRHIKLILRPAYEFKNFSVTPNNPGPVDTQVSVKFELPNIDKSTYPFEVAIRSNVLYSSVADGIRIDTYANGDYAYIYTIQEYGTGKFDVKFKTNATNAGGYITVNAKNFKEEYGEIGTLPTFDFREVSTSRVNDNIILNFTTLVHPLSYMVDITKSSGLTGLSSYEVISVGNQIISFSTTETTGDGTITLASQGYATKEVKFTYEQLTKAGNVQYHYTAVNNQGRVTTDEWRSIPKNATIVTSVPGVSMTIPSTGTGNADGRYRLIIPAGTMMNQPITIYYRYGAESYQRCAVEFNSITQLNDYTGTILMDKQTSL